MRAKNVADSDTPNYHALDLAPSDFSHQLRVASLALEPTNAGHIVAAGSGSPFLDDKGGRFEIRPRGNSVTHEG